MRLCLHARRLHRPGSEPHHTDACARKRGPRAPPDTRPQTPGRLSHLSRRRGSVPWLRESLNLGGTSASGYDSRGRFWIDSAPASLGLPELGAWCRNATPAPQTHDRRRKPGMLRPQLCHAGPGGRGQSFWRRGVDAPASLASPQNITRYCAQKNLLPKHAWPPPPRGPLQAPFFCKGLPESARTISHYISGGASVTPELGPPQLSYQPPPRLKLAR